MKSDEEYEILKKEFDQFVYIVSHDFHGPMRAISNLADWISEDLESIDMPDVTSNLGLLKSRVRRLEAMLDAAKKISRISRQSLSVKSFNPKEVILDILADFQATESIHFSMEGEYPEISSYQVKFQEVLIELIKNAIAFKKADSANLTFTGSIDQNVFGLSLRDEGKGIPDFAIDKIFRLYYTADSKDETNGIGYGLYFVEKIIQFVGGTIEINSKPTEYTEVLLTWPLKTINESNQKK